MDRSKKLHENRKQPRFRDADNELIEEIAAHYDVAPNVLVRELALIGLRNDPRVTEYMQTRKES